MKRCFLLLFSILVIDCYGQYPGWQPQRVIVAEANTNTAAPPASDYTNNLKFWIEADTLGVTTTNNTPVTKAIDKSTNAYVFDDDDQGTRPVYSNSVASLNSQPGLYFNEVDAGLGLNGATNAASEYTLVCVYNALDAGTGTPEVLLDCELGRLAFSHCGNDAPYQVNFYDGSANHVYGTPATGSQVLVFVLKEGAGNAKAYRNGVLLTANETYVAMPIGGYWGVGIRYGYNANFFGGTIADIRLYTEALSDANRQIVEDREGTKYGISITH